MLADFKEEFLASLREWTRDEYRRQWTRSIRAVLAGDAKAVLITTYNSPSVASHLEWWALYRKEGSVVFQNHLLFFDQITGEFVVNRAAEFLKEYRAINEEGVPISEWIVSLDQLQEFVEQ